MPAGSVGHRTGPCIATKEHRRFTECAPTMRQHRTIGVCLGPAGVGNTLSARRHAHWDLAEPLLHGKPGGHARPPMPTCMPPGHALGRFAIPPPSAEPCVSSVKTCL